MATGDSPAAPLSDRHTGIRAQLEQVLSAPAFASSARRAQLLRYLVERALTDDHEGVNEYAIGVDVFGRPPSFDPRIESIVRTQVSRLRQRLAEYYADEGRQDRILIEIPLRSYTPAFVFRQERAATPAAPAPATQLLGPTQRRRPIAAPIAAMVAIAIAILLGVAIAALHLSSNRANLPIRSLVVLPFENYSADGAGQYLADGLTEELTNDFANWQEIHVVARTSAFQYKGKGADVRQIGRELGADAVLEGSLAKQGDHIRVTAQLNRAADGYHLWSQSYETRTLDMLTVQQEIAQAIAAAVRKLGG
jgi:TolB-like protein